MTRFMLLIVTSLMLVCCGGRDADSEGCRDADLDQTLAIVTDGALKDFNSAGGVARVVAPTDLDPYLRRMVDARLALEAEEWPNCTEEVKDHYHAYMTATIEGYRDLAAGKPDEVVLQRQRAALNAWLAATGAFEELSTSD